MSLTKHLQTFGKKGAEVRVRLNRVGGWVVGRWLVGRVCLKIKKKIYISSLSARSKFVLGLRS